MYKSLREKCLALKDLDRGMSNKDVAAKYDVPRSTIATWLKNKETIINAEKAENAENSEKESNAQRQKLAKTGNHELLGSAIFK